MPTTIPHPEHASYHEMDAFFKQLFTTLGYPTTIHASTGTFTDELRIFTLFDEPRDEKRQNIAGYVISVVVCKKEEGVPSKYVEYIFIKSGQVILRDHVAGSDHDKRIPSWSAGVTSLLNLAAKTLRSISETAKNAAATATTLMALYEDPSFSSIPASR